MLQSFKHFFAVKQIQKSFSNEEIFLETLAKSDSLMHISFSIKDGKLFQKISNFKSIGQIEVAMVPIDAIITRLKGKQAQLEVVSKSRRNIEDAIEFETNYQYRIDLDDRLFNTT